MFTHYLRIHCLMLVLFGVSTISQADVYKWQDENGQTHYSQLPPEEGIAVKKIPTAKPPSLDDKTSSQQLDHFLEQQRKQEEQQAAQLKQEQQKKEQEKNKKHNCQAAKKNLQSYQNPAVKRFVNDEGSYARLTPENRAKFISRFNNDISKYCN